MTIDARRPGLTRRSLHAFLAAAAGASAWPAWALDATTLPVTSAQRGQAQKVAQAGVSLSELAANAPDAYTVKRGDTLWDISKLFLKSPWRWPDLWGMNLNSIRNPHLIYPGQQLVLEKSGGRARLRVGQSSGPGDTVKLSPRVRGQAMGIEAISAIPLHLIRPFLTDGVVFESNDLEQAPRVVAAADGRVLLTRGDNAYVRGDLRGMRNFQIFREAKPLVDPQTRTVLGFEGRYVGAAEWRKDGETRSLPDGKPLYVPATFEIKDVRAEVGSGDRLAPAQSSDLSAYAPHAPAQPMDGRIISIYGEGLTAGQNQIVALNRGTREGMERGHVLALWRKGEMAQDKTVEPRLPLQLPDEQHGHLFVFRVFERVSYALILDVTGPVQAGDRFTQP